MILIKIFNTLNAKILNQIAKTSMLAFGNVFHFCQMTLCDVKRKRHFVCWHIITPYNSRNQRYIYFI